MSRLPVYLLYKRLHFTQFVGLRCKHNFTYQYFERRDCHDFYNVNAFTKLCMGRSVRKSYSALYCSLASELELHEDKFANFVTVDEKLISSLMGTFPYPNLTIKNYKHLKSHKDENFSCEYTYETQGSSNRPVYICTLNFSGPFAKEYRGYGTRKKTAESAASLKALADLYKENLIDLKGRPVQEKKIDVEDDRFAQSIREDENLIASLKDKFPIPVNTLKNYNYLKTLTDENYGYERTFKKQERKHIPIFICTLIFSGSSYNNEYIGYGSNKQTAEAAAALKALSYLYEKNLMDLKGRPLNQLRKFRGRPNKYSKLAGNEIHLVMPEKNLVEAETFIQEFDTIVAPLLMKAKERLARETAVGGYLDEAAETTEALYLDLMTFNSVKNEDKSDRDLSMALNLKRIRRNKIESTFPIDAFRDEILQSVAEKPVTIIEGGTGTGKSTQVPQMILNQWTEKLQGSKCNILVAQPRRIAASSLAHWVASGLDRKLGDYVGYKMRLDNVPLKENGGIMFYTAGALREGLLLNPQLEGISHVIIDEVHERSMDIDLLLLLLKRIVQQGDSNVKLILMSATARIDELKKYFAVDGKDDFVISIGSGQPYPITSYYIDDVINDVYNDEKKLTWKRDALDEFSDLRKAPTVNCNLIADVVRYIHQQKGPGAALVFVPGWEDIKNVQARLESDTSLWVLPLHSKLSRRAQMEVFERPEDGRRKVILSTNIAETSITIDDVVYVVDTGLQNDSRYDPSRNISFFEKIWISKANAVQRKGRAGRIQPGEVFMLYTEEVFNQMDQFPLPEILKLPLETFVIRCKSFYEDFCSRTLFAELIDAPSKLALERAIQNLIHLRLLRSVGENSEILTPLGRTVLPISTTPGFSKALVYSALLGCSESALNFAALESKSAEIFSDEKVDNFEFRSLKFERSSRGDLSAMSAFVRDVLGAHKSKCKGSETDLEEGFDDETWPSQTANEMQMESSAASILDNLCPERLKTLIELRHLFTNQLQRCFSALSKRKPLPSDLPQVPDDLLEVGDDLPEITNHLLGVSDELLEEQDDIQLLLASFLSSANFLIKSVHLNNGRRPLLVSENGEKVHLHKSAVLSSDWFEKDELFFSTSVHQIKGSTVSRARDLSVVSALSAALFYGEDLELDTTHEDSENSILKIKGRNIKFQMDKRTADCVLQLRKMWDELIDVTLDFNLKRCEEIAQTIRENDSDSEKYATNDDEDQLEVEGQQLWKVVRHMRNLFSQILDQR